MWRILAAGAAILLALGGAAFVLAALGVKTPLEPVIGFGTT